MQWVYLFSLFLLFIVAALFGARAASLGTIFVVGLAIILAILGWLPPIVFVASLFVVAAISIFIIQKARRKY